MEIEELHCGLHSDHIVSRESFLATSGLHYIAEKMLVEYSAAILEFLTQTGDKIFSINDSI